jgi:prepilin-type N-terminal cleavage/methylation domain-containing protein
MRAWPAANSRRSGFSLMEMMTATTIMAVIMGSAIVVIRSGYAAWNAYEQDIDVAENAYGVLRHFVRQMRQAQDVTAISARRATCRSPRQPASSNRGASTAARRK